MPIATSPARTEPADRLEVAAACPECGGVNSWRLLQTLRRCDYCGSALWWPREEGRPGFLAAEDSADRPAALLDVLQTLDALRERSRIASLRPDRGARGSEIFVSCDDDTTLPGLNELKESRRHLFALQEDHKVLAPYLLASATIVIHALGRSRSVERKEYRSLFFLAEEIVPAYPAPWDFRDRGLWVARQRFRPLTEDDLAARPIRMRDATVDVERLARRWRGQRLLVEPDLEPIAIESDVTAPSPWWVYRPFHFVRARTPMGDGWFLVDGQFANVAGYPGDEEVRRVAARDWAPLDAKEIRTTAVRAIGFRCPECGQDVGLNERGELQLCSNCGRLLEPSPGGLKTRTYAVVDRSSIPWWPDRGRPDVAWLPFFEVRLSVSHGGKRLPDYAALLRDLLSTAGQRAAPVPAELPVFFVPAFDALSASRYDAWAFEWAEALTRARPDCREQRFFVEQPVAKSNRVVPPTMKWEDVRPFLPRLLPALLPKPLQTRLNPVILKRLRSVSAEASSARLVFVPAPVTTEGERRVLGPASSVGWIPLRDGCWPPDLERSVRRAMERGKRMESAPGEGALPGVRDWKARFSS
jgi:hypothetical protein